MLWSIVKFCLALGAGAHNLLEIKFSDVKLIGWQLCIDIHLLGIKSSSKISYHKLGLCDV